MRKYVYLFLFVCLIVFMLFLYNDFHRYNAKADLVPVINESVCYYSTESEQDACNERTLRFVTLFSSKKSLAHVKDYYENKGQQNLYGKLNTAPKRDYVELKNNTLSFLYTKNNDGPIRFVDLIYSYRKTEINNNLNYYFFESRIKTNPDWNIGDTLKYNKIVIDEKTYNVGSHIYKLVNNDQPLSLDDHIERAQDSFVFQNTSSSQIEINLSESSYKSDLFKVFDFFTVYVNDNEISKSSTITLNPNDLLNFEPKEMNHSLFEDGYYLNALNFELSYEFDSEAYRTYVTWPNTTMNVHHYKSSY
ncbi:hypothetical protein [Haloplasma contractile]|uniref:Uncharacterized protein n=1 Tax=Haloplasma contractile SSD-17B TaxID=1033810 RepID=F7PUG4_9MOLU|nr:hypothetical protein [Haloplasma contractile]ERJ11763.1 hypothetical protein HLPCO_002246 [Haloplasma contractile SSD-17B]